MKENTDLRVYKTRKALCNAFTELMKEKSFDAITVNELCDRALVRRATFYKHFLDKYDFFSYFIRYIRSEYMANYSRPEEITSLSDYCIYHVDTFIDFITENRAIVDNVLKRNMLPSLLDILTEEIYTHLLAVIAENDSFHQDSRLSPEVFASFYAGGVIRVLQQWLKSSNTISDDDLKKNVELLLNLLF